MTLTGATLTGVRSGGIVGITSHLPAGGWKIKSGYLLGPQADLSQENLINKDLINKDLSDATLAGATLNSNTILTGTDLTGVRSGGITGTTSHLPPGWEIKAGYLLGPGADLFNARVSPSLWPSLSGANLVGADLNNAALNDANLHLANLAEANLHGALIMHANLNGADLTNADLNGANLRGANMHWANLTGANLSRANLRYAKMQGGVQVVASSSSASILNHSDEDAGAILHLADFSYADLSGVDFNHDTDDSLDATGWETATWTGAYFHYLLEPDWPTGMVYTDHGIVRVPEPTTLLLALLALVAAPLRVRCG